MSTTIRKYEYKPYEYGWKVFYNDETGKEVMEMCYLHESDAKHHTERSNEREPARVAEALAREASLRAMALNYKCSSPADYYGCGRYNGD